MRMVCDCNDFKENMPRLNGATMFSFIHGHQLGKEFIYFRYCPWCAKKLVDEDVYTGDSDHEHGDRIL